MEATRTSRLRAVLVCWQLVTLKVKTNKLTEQIEHMKNTAEKASTSIWQMNKAKVVETACDELGISEHAARKRYLRGALELRRLGETHLEG